MSTKRTKQQSKDNEEVYAIVDQELRDQAIKTAARIHNSIFSSTGSYNELGLGTGIIVSSNGYILSNCHVTGEKSSTCYIILENGYTYEGYVYTVTLGNGATLTTNSVDTLNKYIKRYGKL